MINHKILLALTLALSIFSGCKKDSDVDNSNSNNPTPASGTLTDIDGNTYETVTIHGKVWMKENLKVTHYRNGDPITNITDSATWCNTSSEGWCHYNNDPSISAVYGKLYNWWAVMDSRKIAPAGWHVATSAEYDSLIAYFGGTDVAGKELKELGTTHWINPNNATNSSGFKALPNGIRYGTILQFKSLTLVSYFWTDAGSINIYCYMPNYNDKAHVSPYARHGGLGVRCVKD